MRCSVASSRPANGTLPRPRPAGRVIGSARQSGSLGAASGIVAGRVIASRSSGWQGCGCLRWRRNADPRVRPGKSDRSGRYAGGECRQQVPCAMPLVWIEAPPTRNGLAAASVHVRMVEGVFHPCESAKVTCVRALLVPGGGSPRTTGAERMRHSPSWRSRTGDRKNDCPSRTARAAASAPRCVGSWHQLRGSLGCQIIPTATRSVGCAYVVVEVDQLLVPSATPRRCLTSGRGGRLRERGTPGPAAAR